MIKYWSGYVNSETYFKYKGKYQNWNISTTKNDLGKSLISRRRKTWRNGHLRNLLHTFVFVLFVPAWVNFFKEQNNMSRFYTHLTRYFDKIVYLSRLWFILTHFLISLNSIFGKIWSMVALTEAWAQKVNSLDPILAKTLF